jgi:transcriptional regulator with XRE-family HTH domain
MARPECPIDAAAGALGEFASDLRALRVKAGLSYRELAGIARFSVTALSRAANGRHLPTWPVTQAFVCACKGDEAGWLARWVQLRADLKSKPSGTARRRAVAYEA